VLGANLSVAEPTENVLFTGTGGVALVNGNQSPLTTCRFFTCKNCIYCPACPELEHNKLAAAKAATMRYLSLEGIKGQSSGKNGDK
jgi:hypothetical protein